MAAVSTNKSRIVPTIISSITAKETQDIQNKQDNNIQNDIENGIDAVMVFQCETCRIILGDSTNFVLSNEKLSSFTLNECQNVTKSKEAITSKEGIDMGSTYHELLCDDCQSVVGRMYITTPSTLDDVRDLYSFDTNATTSYVLKNLNQNSSITQNNNEKLSIIETENKNDELQGKIDFLTKELNVTQQLCVILDSKIRDLYSYFKNSNINVHRTEVLDNDTCSIESNILNSSMDSGTKNKKLKKIK